MTCHIWSGVKFSICGILLSLKNIDIGTFQSLKFQGRDALLPGWIGDFICYWMGQGKETCCIKEPVGNFRKYTQQQTVFMCVFQILGPSVMSFLMSLPDTILLQCLVIICDLSIPYSKIKQIRLLLKFNNCTGPSPQWEIRLWPLHLCLFSPHNPMESELIVMNQFSVSNCISRYWPFCLYPRNSTKCENPGSHNES